MAKSRSQPSKRQIIEAMVLAFSSSELHDIVGTDALRSVLAVEYMDIVESGKFDLQQVWELLEQQPGFTAEAAKPPMCLFKSWEETLGMDVILPDALLEASLKDRALLASSCRVSSAQLSRLLPSEAAPGKAVEVESSGRASHSSSARSALTNKPWVLAAATVLAIASFSFVGYSLLQDCRGSQWESISASDFAGDLPIVDAEILGAQVGATLTDASWMSLPYEIRRKQLEAAMRRLENRQIEVLFLRDKHGKVRASAQVDNDGHSVLVRFR